MSTETQLAEPSKLDLVISTSGLADESALTIRTGFSPFFEQAVEWQAKIATVTDPKVARASRLCLKKIRVEASHKKDELKETVLKVGRAVDSAFKVIESTIAPMEDALEAVEKAAERAEQERKSKIKAEREALLQPYGVDTKFYALADMPAEAFGQLLANTKAAHEAKMEAARKAEAERIAREKAEAAERERIRIENERLKREAAEREEAARVEREKARAERERMERERQQAEENARREREFIEAKAAEERRASEAAARAAAEQARKEREELEAKAKAERAAREKAEAEARAIKEAEAKRAAAEEAARKRAARAPDRDKFTAFASYIRGIKTPDATTPEGRAVAAEIAAQVEKFAGWIEQKAATL